MGDDRYIESISVEMALYRAGLPARPCGLNATWNCRAWHVGPSPTPNVHRGDYYIMDQESSLECPDLDPWFTFMVNRDDRGDTDAGNVITVAHSLTLDEAIALVKMLLSFTGR